MDQLLVTPEEAADALGVGRSTIYDLMRLKILPSVKLGRARRIPVAALREWVNKLSAGDAA